MQPPSELDPRFVALFRRLPRDIHGEVVCFFSLYELSVLSETEDWGEEAHAEVDTRVVGLIVDFSLPPVETKEMLRTTHSVMSGSGALYVNNPGAWKPKDIDFYCPVGGLSAVVDFLESQGYHQCDKAGHLTDEEDDVAMDDGSELGGDRYARHVMKTVVFMQKGVEGPTLNVIESLLPCAEAPVFCFHSTTVMNVVTHKGVTCYYPDLTLKNEGVVNRASGLAAWLDRDQEAEEGLLDKYRRRGYTIHKDCEVYHQQGAKDCKVCRMKMTNWDGGLSMTFKRGDTFEPSGRLFCWRLAQRITELNDMFWEDRGVTVFVQGDGDGRMIAYDALKMQAERLTRESILGRFFRNLM